TGERSYQQTAAASTMHYLCAECGAKVGINKGEPIRCKECGHRILYKQRTRSRMVQFEAR
ncbi:DNA directed RNA polymerase, partial [Pyronema omphalodes]